MKRYVKEFADDELSRLDEINPKRKAEIEARIKKAVMLCEKNYITEFEAVRAITEAYIFID